MLDAAETAEDSFFDVTLRTGGTMRMRYWDLKPDTPPRGAVVFGLGRASHIERYKEAYRELLGRGFRVFIPEWLDQGRSERFLGPGQGNYLPSFDVLVDSVNPFLEKVVKRELDNKPLIFVCVSMGALILTRHMVEQKNPAVKETAAVLIAPMFAFTIPRLRTAIKQWAIAKAGFERQSVPRIDTPRYLKALVGAALLLGKGKKYGGIEKPYDPDKHEFEGNHHTDDNVSFEEDRDHLRADRDKITHGATWQWVWSAIRSLDRIHKRKYFDDFTTAVLTITGDHDKITPHHLLSSTIESMGAQNKIIHAARHDLLRSSNDVRAETWRHIDRFLDQYVPR